MRHDKALYKFTLLLFYFTTHWPEPFIPVVLVHIIDH